ncbi:MAG: hypothetical protein AAFV53_19860 [Myxococcota bacterium]
MHKATIAMAAMVFATGCHGKFKRAAPYLDTATVQTVTTGGPYVDLGNIYVVPGTGSEQGDLLVSIAATAVNISQDVKSINQTERIAQAVDLNGINTSMTEGLAHGLAGGPPFAYVGPGGEADATLQMEVLSYGLFVPALGAPGEFTYSVRASVFDNSGDRVYRNTMTCTVGAGNPDAAAVVFGVVNNVKQLERMTDDEINEAFDNMAYYCGQQFAVTMRRHAS